MDAQKKEIEDLIAKTIRQIGHEKDMQDIETLRSFTANMKRKDGIRKFLIPTLLLRLSLYSYFH